MTRFVKPIALMLMALGLALVAIGGVNMIRANEGLASLDAVYEAQGVELSYNEDGLLVDRGTTEGAESIMSLLVDDWKFPVNQAHFDAGDPLVNTPTELMYQYATITYHVLHGTQAVTLADDVEFDGEVFPAGTYEFEVDGRYWTDFNRQHPIEGPARELAWGGAHGLLGSISSGVAADYAAGFAHFAAWRTMLVGLAVLLGGVAVFGLAGREADKILFVASEEKEKVTA
ncbi:MAG TPA: hypothetical protein VGA69_10880 [Nitriliruptorales bacterium]